MIRSELFDWLTKLAGKIIDDLQVLLNSDRRVITALEFVQHHLA